MSVAVRFANLLAFVTFAIAANAQAPIRRVAVLVQDQQDQRFAAQPGGIGQRISDGLISALAGSGRFQVIDRANLDRIVNEQTQGYGNRFSPEGAAKLGKLANVDVLIFGQVDTFSQNQVNENTGSKFVQSGVVDLRATVKMISVETGAIMLAPSAESHQKGALSEINTPSAAAAPPPVVVPGALGGLARSLGGLAQTRSTAPQARSQSPTVSMAQLVDRAVSEVTAQLSTKISAQISATAISMQSVPVAPKFVGIEDGLVVVNKGLNAGVKVGDTFIVSRSTDIGFKDPDTGKPILRKKQQCVLTITVVEDAISSGKCDGPGVPQAGDEFAPAPRQ
jgi:hypothetical protein